MSAAMPAGPLGARLAELARITRAPSPVVSAYLNTLWSDEHQRHRVRVFLADEIRKAREAGGPPALAADLDWIAQQGEALIAQAQHPDAHGVVARHRAGEGRRHRDGDRRPASAPKMIRAQLKGMIAQLERERRAEVEKVLDRAARELKAKVTRLTRSMPTGHPAREIVAAAASFDADLVVVGARGLGGMKRLLLGSVSERVLHDARCPVMIVKGTSRT